MKGESKIFHDSPLLGEFTREDAAEEEEWAVKRNLRAINERGQQLHRFAEEARLRYKHSPEESEMHLMNLM